MKATQTGAPIIPCDCGAEHPSTRVHCTSCGRASVFVNAGLCLRCRKEVNGAENQDDQAGVLDR